MFCEYVNVLMAGIRWESAACLSGSTGVGAAWAAADNGTASNNATRPTRYGMSVRRIGYLTSCDGELGRSRTAQHGPAGGRVSTPRLVQPGGVAEVGVALQERQTVDLAMPRSVVAKDVETVPDVDHVDQPVLDDREAPHDDLVRATAKRRVLGGHRTQRGRREPTGLRRLSRVLDVDGLQPRRVPRIQHEVAGQQRVVQGVTGELLGGRIVRRATAERAQVGRCPVLTDDVRTTWLGRVD